ncbi:MAG: hypothetical protein P1U56_23115 [Saprospiraceae bacterium]|nr:hypothetical protein [Saprospiraceae bacterium]
MKQIDLFLFFLILLPFCGFSQSATWAVKAVKGGDAFPVHVYLDDATPVPVFAIYNEGNDHFMDVKGVHNGKNVSIKLVRSSDMLIPVKGISETGEILKVKAIDSKGGILDVKGVSRDGNTINVCAVKGENDYIPLMAVSPEGVKRTVKGVKFMSENVEMELSGVKVLAHLKAIPTVEVGSIDKKWGLQASTDDGQSLSVVAINKKGREYPVNAIMAGKHPYLMHVRAEGSVDIYVKFVKNDNGVMVTGIDEYGRPYDIKAKATDGTMYGVNGGEKTGNVIPVYVMGANGATYPVKAVSSKGHEFDVKGIKAKKGDVEGSIAGIDGEVNYYAHIKALAPAQAEKK